MLRPVNGFTLVEVLVATTIGMGLLLVIYSFLEHAITMSQIMLSRVQLNAEARLGFDLLGNGGRVGVFDVAGLRGSGDVDAGALSPGGAVIGRDVAQKLVIDAGANGTLTSTELNVLIACDGIASPHPDCGVDNTLTVGGYLASAPVVDDGMRTLNVSAHCAGNGVSRPATAEVGLDLMDPHLLGANENFTADQYRVEYQNVLGLYADCL